ncbi:hypothetical protein ACFL09_05055 [Planctomycetota bacterium]
MIRMDVNKLGAKLLKEQCRNETERVVKSVKRTERDKRVRRE